MRLERVSSAIKAGLLAGLIQGLVEGAVIYLITPASKSDIILAISAEFFPIGVSPEKVYDMMLVSIIPRITISDLSIGFIAGVIFGLIYEKLPGTTSSTKGVILSTIPWLIAALRNHYVLILTTTYSLACLAIGFLTWVLIFGTLLGYFYDKFAK